MTHQQTSLQRNSLGNDFHWIHLGATHCQVPGDEPTSCLSCVGAAVRSPPSLRRMASQQRRDQDCSITINPQSLVFLNYDWHNSSCIPKTAHWKHWPLSPSHLPLACWLPQHLGPTPVGCNTELTKKLGTRSRRKAAEPAHGAPIGNTQRLSKRTRSSGDAEVAGVLLPPFI